MGVKKNKGVKQKNEKKVADIKNGCQTAKKRKKKTKSKSAH